MPLINVKVIEGVFSGSQKQRDRKELTEAMVRVEGENMRPALATDHHRLRPCGGWAIVFRNV